MLRQNALSWRQRAKLSIKRNLNHLFPTSGRKRSLTLVRNLPKSILKACTRYCPFSDDRPKVAKLLKLGHIGPILQVAGGELSFKNCKIPPHSHREKSKNRFDLVFSKNYYGCIFFLQLFECGILSRHID